MSFARRPLQTPIHDLQMMLRVVLPDQGLGLDGIYGSETQDAVRAFQKQQGLPQSGATDIGTWEALVSAYDREKVLQAQAAPHRVVLQPHQVIARGTKNLNLYQIQGMLLALAQLYYDLPLLQVTGTLDNDTANAILWLQKSANLQQTGELDKLTWLYLVHQHRLMIGDGTGSFPIRRTQRQAGE